MQRFGKLTLACKNNKQGHNSCFTDSRNKDERIGGLKLHITNKSVVSELSDLGSSSKVFFRHGTDFSVEGGVRILKD